MSGSASRASVRDGQSDESSAVGRTGQSRYAETVDSTTYFPATGASVPAVTAMYGGS